MSAQKRTSPMPEINSDKVCFVIVKAREFDVQVEGLEADDSNATDDNFASVFATGRDDSVRRELKAFIDAMDEDEQCELVALCWLGRGDFSADEWEDAVAEARGPASGLDRGVSDRHPSGVGLSRRGPRRNSTSPARASRWGGSEPGPDQEMTRKSNADAARNRFPEFRALGGGPLRDRKTGQAARKIFRPDHELPRHSRRAADAAPQRAICSRSIFASRCRSIRTSSSAKRTAMRPSIEHVLVAIKDAFAAAQRQIEDASARCAVRSSRSLRKATAA